MKEVADNQGLVHVELELAVHAADGASNLVTHNLSADHGEGLALGGVDLAGHDGRTGLVLREVELAETATGAAAEVADVLSNLAERGSEGVEAAVGLDDGVVGSERLELVGGSLELGAGHLGNLLGDGLGEALEGVDAGADGGAALGEEAEVGEGRLDALDAEVELGNIAAELLSEGQGSGILKMGAANLDDLLGLELLNLGLERIAKALERREEGVLKLEHSSNVHDGGEGVVGRSRAVDVVVGVHRLLGAHLAAQNLDGSVADDLVGVHVGLSAGAGLPDDEGEVVEELEVSNLLRGLLNGLADLRIYILPVWSAPRSSSDDIYQSASQERKKRVHTKAIAHVHRRRSTLEDTERLDDRRGHAVLGLVDLEVLEGTLSLSAPVLVGRDLDLAKGIALGSGVGRHSHGTTVEGSLVADGGVGGLAVGK